MYRALWDIIIICERCNNYKYGSEANILSQSVSIFNISVMAAESYCRDLVFEIIGDAVELGKAPEIDLRDMFGTVDIRGGDYAGKGGGKGGSGLEQVASGGEGEGRTTVALLSIKSSPVNRFWCFRC